MVVADVVSKDCIVTFGNRQCYHLRNLPIVVAVVVVVVEAIPNDGIVIRKRTQHYNAVNLPVVVVVVGEVTNDCVFLCCDTQRNVLATYFHWLLLSMQHLIMVLLFVV